MGNFINQGQTRDVYMADHDINVNNGGNDLGSVKELITTMLELVERNSDTIEPEQKESIVEDLNTIQEQTVSSKPSSIKIKKALNGIFYVIKSIPKGLAWTQLLLSNAENLQKMITDFVNNLNI